MIIIDANVASEFADRTEEARSISLWLIKRGRWSVGGTNLVELLKTPIREFLVEMERAGKVLRVSDAAVEKAEQHISSKIKIRSDDPHVLALAIVGGARLLYSRDTALICDFVDTGIVSRPRGKCYRIARKHKHLLS